MVYVSIVGTNKRVLDKRIDFIRILGIYFIVVLMYLLYDLYCYLTVSSIYNLWNISLLQSTIKTLKRKGTLLIQALLKWIVWLKTLHINFAKFSKCNKRYKIEKHDVIYALEYKKVKSYKA